MNIRQSLIKYFPEPFLSSCVERLPAAYFEYYSEDEIKVHLKLIQELESGILVRLSISKLNEKISRVSIACDDFIGLFSVVSGVISSLGINIQQGNVWVLGKKVLILLEIELKQELDWQKVEMDLRQFLKKVKAGKLDEVRREINIRIVAFFRSHKESYFEKLYPIHLEIDQNESQRETIVSLKTQDTLAFLYELTNALSLLDMNIARMEIKTKDNLISDRIWLTSNLGEKITSERKLKELRWAILLVKQFTHLLPKVPDPLVALDQITSLGKEIFGRKDFNELFEKLEDGETLKHLSKVFGTSRFLWEEFIRTEHAALIPLLGDQNAKKRKSLSVMKRELVQHLRQAKDFKAKVEVLNQYKDREMFRIDVRHLLWKAPYLEEFAQEFSDLCEAIAEAAYHLAWDQVGEKMLIPLVSQKERSELSILALGKFGGRELGYASDLELLFVYTDHLDTTGEQSQKNLEFYSELVRVFRAVIWARSEGVFEVDLRLRPHGKNGPLAVSLQLFKNYYSETGEAWSFERQALVKLRAVAGSPWLGKEVERLRDEFVYSNKLYDFEEAKSLREKQKSELVQPGTINAKYSTGGLIDIEYLVQTLQIAFGKTDSHLRETNTFRAMRALWQRGVLSEQEFQSLRAAYFFIRDLINALRIYRGNAKDLTIPPKEDIEYIVLARRMGYEGADHDIKKKFEHALEHHRNIAAESYARWMKGLSETKWEEIAVIQTDFPTKTKINLDEILRGDVSEISANVLRQAGFLDVSEVVNRVKRMFPGTLAFESFGKTFDQIWTIWPEVPDPSLALKHLEQFSEAFSDKGEFWNLLAQETTALKRLLRLFGSSCYLSEILITNPSYWKFVVNPHSLTAIVNEIKEFAADKIENWRKFRHLTTFRIGLIEMENKEDLDLIFNAFSILADRILCAVFENKNFKENGVVIGLGKLGGGELNFSSDVDLLFLFKSGMDVMTQVESGIQTLTQITADGFLHRVDLRLRPYGNAGAAAISTEDARYYYEKEAEPWEYQMLLKARFVAGNEKLAASWLSGISNLIFNADWKNYFERLRDVKRRYEAQTRSRGEEEKNIKMGLGGIRDIEFSVQTFQLRYGKKKNDLRSTNTLEVMSAIQKNELLADDKIKTLKEGYLFLRRIENKLHLFDNRQTFLIPQSKQDLRRLARSMGFHDSVSLRAEDQFEGVLRRTMNQCRQIFEHIFFGS